MSQEDDYQRWKERLPPAARRPPECTHASFGAFVAVNRMEDSGTFVADVRILCVECREPFRFIGTDAGMRFDRPTTSIDDLELHAPIEPEGEKRLHATASFHMPANAIVNIKFRRRH